MPFHLLPYLWPSFNADLPHETVTQLVRAHGRRGCGRSRAIRADVDNKHGGG